MSSTEQCEHGSATHFQQISQCLDNGHPILKLERNDMKMCKVLFFQNGCTV